MKLLLIILGMTVGGAIAWLLNKRFADKIEDKTQKLVMKILAFIVFMLLGLLFGSVCSLKPVLSKFLDGRIAALENTLNKNFPGTNLMETNINTDEFIEYSNQIQQTINNVNTSDDSMFEKMVYSALIAKITPYINAVESGVNTMASMTNEQGIVTIKSVVLGFKKSAIDTISPWFIAFNVLIFIAFMIAVGAYCGIVYVMRKDGTGTEKGMVFGEVSTNNIEETSFRRE
jgi:hypothetical protein